MSKNALGEALRRNKVIVDFEGGHHYFRLIEGHTFGSLLHDSAKHWMIDEDDYELQDEDGCTWPASGTCRLPSYLDKWKLIATSNTPSYYTQMHQN